MWTYYTIYDLYYLHTYMLINMWANPSKHETKCNAGQWWARYVDGGPTLPRHFTKNVGYQRFWAQSGERESFCVRVVLNNYEGSISGPC